MKDGVRISAGVLAAIVVAFLLAALIASMAIFGWGMFARQTADFRGQTDAIEQVQADGTFRIAAYERFYDLCASIQADESRIATMQAELDDEATSDRRAEQLRTSLTAVKASRAEKVASYNADAAKDFTVGQFRDAGLPHQINVDGLSADCA